MWMYIMCFTAIFILLSKFLAAAEERKRGEETKIEKCREVVYTREKRKKKKNK